MKMAGWSVEVAEMVNVGDALAIRALEIDPPWDDPTHVMA